MSNSLIHCRVILPACVDDITCSTECVNEFQCAIMKIQRTALLLRTRTDFAFSHRKTVASTLLSTLSERPSPRSRTVHFGETYCMLEETISDSPWILHATTKLDRPIPRLSLGEWRRFPHCYFGSWYHRWEKQKEVITSLCLLPSLP